MPSITSVGNSDALDKSSSRESLVIVWDRVRHYGWGPTVNHAPAPSDQVSTFFCAICDRFTQESRTTLISNGHTHSEYVGLVVQQSVCALEGRWRPTKHLRTIAFDQILANAFLAALCCRAATKSGVAHIRDAHALSEVEFGFVRKAHDGMWQGRRLPTFGWLAFSYWHVVPFGRASDVWPPCITTCTL